MVEPPTVNRRTALKGIGGLAALGAGGFALSGAAGAQSGASITAQAVQVSNDTGDLSELFIQPELTVGWSGFDEVIDRLRVLIEARPGGVTSGGAAGDGYWPVYRETPWLDNEDYYPERENAPGTSGTFSGYLYSRFSELPKGSNDFASESLSVPGDLPRIVLFSDDYTRPDYDGDYGQDYLTGVSIAGGGNYLNGSYGVAGGTGAFDEDADGVTNDASVDLRFTISLQTAEAVGGTPDADPVAMAQAGEDYDVADYGVTNEAHALTYADLRAMASQGHPSVIVTETSYDVSVENVQATPTAPSGTAGTGGN